MNDGDEIREELREAVDPLARHHRNNKTGELSQFVLSPLPLTGLLSPCLYLAFQFFSLSLPLCFPLCRSSPLPPSLCLCVSMCLLPSLPVSVSLVIKRESSRPLATRMRGDRKLAGLRGQRLGQGDTETEGDRETEGEIKEEIDPHEEGKKQQER